MPTGLEEAEAAVELFLIAKKQGWLDQLATALKKKHHILVLGTTGVGKTNFLRSLSEVVPAAVDIMNRTQVAQKYRIRIAKEPFVFVDTPGQEMHHSRRLQAIREAMSTGIDGVLNIVCYGFHESRTGKSIAFRADGSISEAFLDARRKEEVRAMSEWALLLGDAKTAKWLFSVVTKADLWWQKREEVLNYYETGDYYQSLGGLQVLNPMVLEYSSVFQKFYGEGRMSGDFQDADRVRARAHLLKELLAAVGREAPRK